MLEFHAVLFMTLCSIRDYGETGGLKVLAESQIKHLRRTTKPSSFKSLLNDDYQNKLNISSIPLITLYILR
jgi:hypothetical protein